MSTDDAVSVDDAVTREIGHDEYDPVGTLTLIGLYFLILAGMWVFIYFVEFLGNDPTVVGSVSTEALSMVALA